MGLGVPVISTAKPACNRVHFESFTVAGKNHNLRAKKKTRLQQDSVLERPLNQHPATVAQVRSNPVQP